MSSAFAAPKRAYTFKEGLAMMAAKEMGIDPYLAAEAGDDARGILANLRKAKAAKGADKAKHLAAAQSDLRKLSPKQHGKLINALQAKLLALQGRGGDTAVAHLEPGEMVIPRHLLTPELARLIAAEAAKRGIAPEQLIVGGRGASINPHTGTEEFGLFGGRDEDKLDVDVIPVSATRRHEVLNELDRNESWSGGELGVATYLSDQLARAGNERGRLVEDVSKLHPQDTASRTRLKEESRTRTPAFFRGVIEEGRPNVSPKPGSGGTANRSNPIVDAFGKAGRVAGPGVFALTLKEAQDRIDKAENKTRETFGVGGSMIGGYGTGILTGLAGRGLARSANGLAGSAAGAVAGEKAGYGLYDNYDRLMNNIHHLRHGN